MGFFIFIYIVIKCIVYLVGREKVNYLSRYVMSITKNEIQYFVRIGRG